MVRVVTLLLCAVVLALADGAAAAGPATQIIVLLPGQELVPGVGLVGAAHDQVQRTRFRVEAYAVDAFGNIDASYAGPIRGVVTDDPQPVHGQRFGTSISAIGAATSVTDGHLKLSLDGSSFQEIQLGSPTSGDEVCAAIVAGVDAVPAHLWGTGLAFKCILESFSLRYSLFFEDGTPTRATSAFRSSSVSVDPSFGSAPLLGLGVSSPSADPNAPEELSAQVLDPPPLFGQRFSRGIAVYEIFAAEPASARTLSVDQGSGPALPVVSSTFRVLPSSLVIEQVTLHDENRDGAFDQAQIFFNHELDPASIAGQAASFELHLTTPGQTVVQSGSTIALAPDDSLGFAASRLDVGFSTGIPKTDVDDVSFHVLPSAASLQSAETGELFDPAAGVVPPLVDGAPPVLVSTFAQDTDGNGAHDRLEFFFSEPVQFSASRAYSLGGDPFDPDLPTADPYVTTPLPAPSSLRIRTGAAGIEHVLTLVDADDATLPTITGGAAIARAITLAARHADPDPAWAHFTARFDPEFRRFILVSGSVGDGSSLAVLPSGMPDDAAPQLKLGAANGGVERAGSGADQPRIEDFMVLSPFGGVNLLAGMTESDVVIDGNRVLVTLTNVPGSGVGTPSFVWVQDFGGGALADLADEPNLVHPFNNVGNPPVFAPPRFIKIRDTDSAPDDGIVTRSTGSVALDASPTVAPLTSLNGPSFVRFRWVQVSGPVAVAIASPNDLVTSASIPLAGTYVFEAQLTVQPESPPTFNPHVRSDGTLARRFTYVVRPRPCGIGFELALCLPPLAWLRRRRSR